MASWRSCPEILNSSGPFRDWNPVRKLKPVFFGDAVLILRTRLAVRIGRIKHGPAQNDQCWPPRTQLCHLS
jgi:hypothetical protein